MILYLGIFSFLMIGGLAAGERKATFYLFCVFMFLVWFMGARFNVGCDFSGYYNRYLQSPTDFSVRDLMADFEEPGFWLLSSFVRSQGLSYMWLNIFSTLIILACLWVFCRAHRDSAMILALLFPIIILQLGMSGLRQAIATGFLLVASVAWMKKKRLRTAIWILIGAQFHASVVLFLPIALVAGKRVSTMRLLGAAIVIGPLAAYLMSDRIDRYSNIYFGSEVTSGGALIRFTLILIPAIFFVIYRRRVEAEYPEQYELLKLFTIFAFSLIPIAVFSSIMLHRVNYYIMPFSIVSFVYLSRVAYSGKDEFTALFVRILPGMTYGFYSLSWFLTSFHAGYCYVPYNNYAFF